MNDWLRQQLEAGFAVYQTQLAMQLHFQDQGYDYTRYQGKTRATLKAFASHPKKAHALRVSRLLKSKNIEAPRFFFSVFRVKYVPLEVIGAAEVMLYQDWEAKFGSKKQLLGYVSQMIRQMYSAGSPRLSEDLDGHLHAVCDMINQGAAEPELALPYLADPSLGFHQWFDRDDFTVRAVRDRVLKLLPLYKFFGVW